MRKAAAKSAIWSVLELGGGQALSFLLFLILTWFLAPSDYGVVALAGALISIPNVLINQGFAEALIQREDLRDEHVSTALWSNLAIALAFMAAAIAGADAVAWISGEREAAPVLRWLSLNFLVTGLTSVPAAIYRRELRFATFAIRTLAAGSVAGIVGVALAAMGYGVWALVANQVAHGAVTILVIWWGFRIRTFRFSLPAFRDMASFSAHVMSANLVNYTTTKVDQLIVGTFLGVESLGYYYVSQRLIETVGAVCYEPFRLIAMPVLSRFQFDRERFDRIYRSLVWTSTAAWLPALGGLALLADTFIPLLFGHKWDNAIGLFQVMALVSITAAIPVHTNRALLSAGQANEFRNLSLLQLAITVVLFALAARFGMLAVGAAYAAVPLALTPFHLRALGRIGISSGWLVLRCLLILVAGLAMAGFVVSTWGAQLPGPGWFRVAFEVLGGALTYVTVLSVIARRETVEVVDLIRGMLPGFGRAQFTARKTPHIVGCGHIRARIRTWPSRSSRS